MASVACSSWERRESRWAYFLPDLRWLSGQETDRVIARGHLNQATISQTHSVRPLSGVSLGGVLSSFQGAEILVGPLFP